MSTVLVLSTDDMNHWGSDEETQFGQKSMRKKSLLDYSCGSEGLKSQSPRLLKLKLELLHAETT